MWNREQGERVGGAMRLMNSSHLMGVATAIVVLALATGCQPADSPVPTPAPNASGPTTSPGASPTTVVLAVPITITRTGGIAGVRDQLSIDPAGAWQSTTKSGQKKTGQLTAGQIAELQRLAHDPHVATEAKAPTQPPACADGFNYSVRVDAAEIRFEDCAHSAEPRVAKAIVGLVQGAVPGW
jgi:hypothetical protein